MLQTWFSGSLSNQQAAAVLGEGRGPATGPPGWQAGPCVANHTLEGGRGSLNPELPGHSRGPQRRRQWQGGGMCHT